MANGTAIHANAARQRHHWCKLAANKIPSAIGNENKILVEQSLQSLTDTPLDPIPIELEADVAHARLGGGDALDLAQHARGMVLERAREQLPFDVERNLVGAVRGAQHRHHHANDGDRDDDADRHHDAQAYVAPTISFAPFAEIGGSQGQVSFPNGYFALRP